MTDIFKNRTEQFYAGDGSEPVEMNVRSIIGQHATPSLYAHKPRPGMVNKIVVHQCGCPMPSQIQGWVRLNAHIGITTEGMIYCINNPVDFIWHANALSPLAIGIEVEGNWYGFKGNKKTLWQGGGKAATMTTEIKNAITYALFMCNEWMVAQTPVTKWEKITNAKPEFKGVFTHRQSSAMKEWDCGQAIYKVVDEFNRKKLSPALLKQCREYHSGTGSAVPGAWYLE